MNLLDYENKFSTLRVLLTGLSGSGKSTLAASLAKMFNVYWIDIENAVDTLAKLPVEQKRRITLIKIPDSAAFPVAAQTVQTLFRYGKANICEEHGVVDCSACKKENNAFQSIDFNSLNPKTDVVVLDSLTQVGYSMLAHLTKSKPIDYKPERDDWGGLRKHTEYLASNIQAAKYNLVVTALPSEVVLEDGRTKLVPSFGSKDMSAAVGAKFSTIIYCDVKNKKHFAYSSSTASNTFLSKSRTGYVIDEDTPDLCPMFVEYLGTEKAVDVLPAIDKLEVKPAATPAQSALNNLRAKQNLGAGTTPK